MTPHPTAILGLKRKALLAGAALLVPVAALLAAPIEGAVIAPGVVAVESSVKLVQHPAGGVVREILARDGDRVAAGQALIRLDESQPRAALAVIRHQIDALEARRARLAAERDGAAEVAAPEALAARLDDRQVGEALDGERALFRARAEQFAAELSELDSRRAQLADRIAGLTVLRDARAAEAAFLAEETAAFDGLYAKGLTTLTRLNGARRDLARVEGDRGEIEGEIAKLEGEREAVAVEAARARARRQGEIVDEMAEVRLRLAELAERRSAAEEQLARSVIRAPRTGSSTAWRSTRTAARSPRARPSLASFRIPMDSSSRRAFRLATPTWCARARRCESACSPATCARAPRSKARWPSSRPTPPRIARPARPTTSPASRSIARREAAAGVSLRAGMPAEAFVATGSRSAFAYLVEPLTARAAHAMRER